MDVSEQLNSLPEMNKAALGALWRKHFGAPPPEQTLDENEAAKASNFNKEQ